VRSGFVALGAMPYQQAHDEVARTGSLNPIPQGTSQGMTKVEGAHPISCVDCHEPDTVQLRVTRPGFILGIQALLRPTRRCRTCRASDAGARARARGPTIPTRTRAAASCARSSAASASILLRSEDHAVLSRNRGLNVEDIEACRTHVPDGHRFDWQHAETGGEMLKAQHPEFELWSQGITRGRRRVRRATCRTAHGAMKVDHRVRPLLMVNRRARCATRMAKAS
jgi:nitrite reductase (cytochrome c-552)